MRKVRPVKLRYRKLNGLRLRLIAERITGKPAVILLAHCVSLLPERESPVERTTHGKHNR